MTDIGGHLVGLVGAGIGESLSPALHEREAAEQGLDYAYRLHDLAVSPADVGDLLECAREAGYRGLNVTHPCKRAVVEHLDELSAEAEAVGAVNTVVFDGDRAVGHNTDVTGFAESFARGLPGAPVDHVVLLGAGGAGAAVAQALGAGRLTIVDVEPGRASALARRMGAAAGDLAALASADGLVHATPTGMAAHPGLPLPEDALHDGLWVAEVVYRPLETELLRVARARGCRTLDGGGMAVFQAAGSFELFTGVEPDRDRMLRHFAELAGMAAR
jgi:quinate/shikimate dehydrogenase (NAD+)